MRTLAYRILLPLLLVLRSGICYAQPYSEPCTGTGALDGNWTQGAVSGTTVNVVRATNVCQPDNPITSRDIIAYYSGGTFNNDQYAQATFSLITTGAHYNILAVRASGSNSTLNTYYIAVSTTEMYVSRYLSGSGSDLEHRTGLTFTSGDVIKLQIVGTTITIFRNGSQSGATVTDSNIASGKPGQGGYNETAVLQSNDDWEGGNTGGGGGSTNTSYLITLGIGKYYETRCGTFRNYFNRILFGDGSCSINR